MERLLQQKMYTWRTSSHQVFVRKPEKVGEVGFEVMEGIP